MPQHFCHKVPHDSKAEAKADIKYRQTQAKHFNKRYRDVRKVTKKLKPFECPYCNKWHVR